MPGDSFAVTLTVPGVYDLYCQPHEEVGMAARLAVGGRHDAGWQGAAADPGNLPPPALAAFPSVDTILASGAVQARLP